MVILVNPDDVALGCMPKMEAHEKGLLHRAFSVFIFNSEGKLLMQQRAGDKYHSAGLWTNTCCSHPFPGEKTKNAAQRRLMEEMGLKAELKFLFRFQYLAPFDNSLTEHEIDHVFAGKTDEKPVVNPKEVSSYKYVSISELKMDIEVNPEQYTCLLYTSPSPRDRTRSRMPSSA
jgi:isopentenyl-diphosphate delta-isomerase